MVKFYIIQKSQVSSAPVPQQPDVQSISKLKAQIFFFYSFFFFYFAHMERTWTEQKGVM